MRIFRQMLAMYLFMLLGVLVGIIAMTGVKHPDVKDGAWFVCTLIALFGGALAGTYVKGRD